MLFFVELLCEFSVVTCYLELEEILGVSYGLIFGNYKYGEVLGYKIFKTG